jgi:uncharacterized protein YkwD
MKGLGKYYALLFSTVIVGVALGVLISRPSSTPAHTPTVAAASNKLTPLTAEAVNLNELFTLTNQDRNGISPLARDTALDNVASDRCNDMASRHYFAHDGPNGMPPWATFVKYTQYKRAAENLAEFPYKVTAFDVNNAWMNSLEHKDNILDPALDKVGYASCVGTYQDKQTIFIVSEFIQSI